MGITDKPKQTQENRLLPPENFGVKCMSKGMLVDEEEPMIPAGPYGDGRTAADAHGGRVDAS